MLRAVVTFAASKVLPMIASSAGAREVLRNIVQQLVERLQGEGILPSPPPPHNAPSPRSDAPFELLQLRALVAAASGGLDDAIAQLNALANRRHDMSPKLFQDIKLETADLLERKGQWAAAAEAVRTAREVSDDDVDVLHKHASLLDKADGHGADFQVVLARLMDLAPSASAPGRFPSESPSE